MDNFVLVTIDSLRSDHCGFMGYDRNTTPTLDQLAEEGLTATNAVTAGIGTPASMSCIFTGEFTSVSGEDTHPSPWRSIYGRRKTLAEVLRANGYSTGAFTPNAFVSSFFGFDKGFDMYQDFLSDSGIGNRLYRRILGRAAQSGKNGVAAAMRNVRDLIQREEIFKPWEDFYDQIINWVNSVQEPYFLWVLLLDTHHPYLAPRKSREWSSAKDMWYANWKLQQSGWDSGLSQSVVSKLIDAYDDSILYADTFLARLQQDLRSTDPVYVIHGDHGEAFGEHNIFGHGAHLYEEFIHVPLVVSGLKREKTITSPVSLRQIPSTILEEANTSTRFEAPPIGEPQPYVISDVHDHTHRRIAVRSKDWKYIVGENPSNELYNLRKDPGESNNQIEANPELGDLLGSAVERHKLNRAERSGIRQSVSELQQI